MPIGALLRGRALHTLDREVAIGAGERSFGFSRSRPAARARWAYTGTSVVLLIPSTCPASRGAFSRISNANMGGAAGALYAAWRLLSSQSKREQRSTDEKKNSASAPDHVRTDNAEQSSN
jgi:hypothetical protein